jgi:metallophosphoesterase (TIGR00282 family)
LSRFSRTCIAQSVTFSKSVIGKQTLRILFIGDIVGQPGVEMVQRCLPALRRTESLDIVIANGENADGGSGISPAIYRKLRECGVDCITLGDHAFRKKDILEILESKKDIIRPANYPAEAPGTGWTIIGPAAGPRVAVINLIGRVFMKPADCPFHCADRILAGIPDDVVVRFVDFHAEATSDKQLMAHHLDGRVSALIGTHTHVATADECVRASGTAFMCDVGMTGPHDSILGRKKEAVMETTFSFRPRTFHVASNDNRISAALIDIDPRTGSSRSIRRLSIDERRAALLDDDE